MMDFTSSPDVALQITVPSDTPSAPPLISSERRINPSWTIGQFKSKMEPITGIPPGSMKIVVRGVDVGETMGDGEVVGRWGLGRGEGVEIHDLRPPSLRPNLSFDPSDPDAAPKYTMPTTTYESLPSSVLAWKKANNLGRFDPTAPTPDLIASQRHEKDSKAIADASISIGERCRVGRSDQRRGQVAYIGTVDEIEKEKGAIWVGVAFDEPVGRNDGRVGGGKRYFECQGEKYGGFVRPENVEVGAEWEVLDDLEDGDMEEI